MAYWENLKKDAKEAAQESWKAIDDLPKYDPFSPTRTIVGKAALFALGATLGTLSKQIDRATGERR